MLDILNMNESQIDTLLKLQNYAYEFLLWINQRAMDDPSILSDQNLEKWSSPATCEEWVRQVLGMIPASIRPAESELPAFSKLFRAFFHTSFRVVDKSSVRASNDWGDPIWVSSRKRRLVAGPPGGKRTPKGKAKKEKSADELCLHALDELALEAGYCCSRDQLNQLRTNESYATEVVLWTYIHELERRANFSSQGEPVLLLWVSLPKKLRENISTERVLRAQHILQQAIRENYACSSSN